MFLAGILKHNFTSKNIKQTSIEFLVVRIVSKLERILTSKSLRIYAFKAINWPLLQPTKIKN